MLRYLSQFAMLLATAAVVSLPAMANPSSNDTLKTNISINLNTTVQNKNLKPGDYKVEVEGNEAKFLQKGKLVTEVPCTIETLPAKSQYTDVVTNHGKLTEIDMSGKTQAIHFGS